MPKKGASGNFFPASKSNQVFNGDSGGNPSDKKLEILPLFILSSRSKGFAAKRTTIPY